MLQRNGKAQRPQWRPGCKVFAIEGLGTIGRSGGQDYGGVNYVATTPALDIASLVLKKSSAAAVRTLHPYRYLHLCPSLYLPLRLSLSLPVSLLIFYSTFQPWYSA